MFNSSQLYHFFKKGELPQVTDKKSVPTEVLQQALVSIEKEFADCSVSTTTLTDGCIQATGYVIYDKNHAPCALGVLNLSTRIQDKLLFKAAVFHVLSAQVTTNNLPVFAININKNFAVNHLGLPLFYLTDISDGSTFYTSDAVQVISDVQTLTECKASDVSDKPQNILPKPFKKALKQFFTANADVLMADIPDALLNNLQSRVKNAHITNTPYIDINALRSALEEQCDFNKPIYMLDFEATQFLIPLWYDIYPSSSRSASLLSLSIMGERNSKYPPL